MSYSTASAAHKAHGTCDAPLSRGGSCIKPKAPGSPYCAQHTRLIYGAKLSEATDKLVIPFSKGSRK